MNVTKLIEYLKSFDGDLLIGAIDDYGVFVPMGKYNFHVSMAHEKMPRDLSFDSVPDRISVLEISMPDVFRL